MDRRDFLALSAASLAGLALNTGWCASSSPVPAAQPRIPRWRGFNLTELTGGSTARSFRESDFAWMAEWGFDFARLPLSYWAWSRPKAARWMAIDEAAFKPVDEAVEFGRRHGIHVNLNLHRIPGYCVNQREREPFLLFDSSAESMQRALEAALHHWRFIATRYRHIPAAQLSFDLLNEPPWMKDHARYVAIARALVSAIRAISPDRLIVVDGADIGQTPVTDLIDLGIVQSTRGYLPKMVSHFTATWVPPNEFESFERPRWPMVDAKGVRWDREKLRSALIEPWRPLVERGAPVHVGEWGCFVKTPHDVALAWMADLLALWKEAGWGWAMWNLRGSFGIVDSNRADVKYEPFRGHQLDRRMLELLRAH